MSVENRAARVHYEAESIRAGWSVRHLESFLLELGAGFTFVARQKRIRIGDEWYRIDLLLYHRALRCLVVVDLKLGRFSHADAGQMNLLAGSSAVRRTTPSFTTRWVGSTRTSSRRGI